MWKSTKTVALEQHMDAITVAVAAPGRQSPEFCGSLDLRVVFFLTQRVCRQMLSQGDGGSVVNISSVHSQSCLPGAGPYDAAKWGVVGMGKSMAVELAPQGIRVNAISPGLLNTQIWQDLQSAAPSPEACLDYWKQNIPIGPCHLAGGDRRTGGVSAV